MTDSLTIPGRGPAPLVLGAYLRSLRLAKGLTPTAAADAIRSSPSKINRMETGQVAQRWEDVSTLTRLYGVTDMDTITGAMRWTGWQSTDPERFPGPIRDDAEGWMDRLRACEHQASEICVYASVTMPRIVQTTGCPVDRLTLLTSSAQPPRVPVHTALADQTQDVTVLLDGAMLLRTLGNPLAMAAQMAYLQRLATSPHGPRVVVVPLRTGTVPPPGTLHRFHLHGQEVFAEETWSAVYASGTDGQAARDRLAAGLQAAKDPEASAALLDAARRRFELLAEDPASDPLLEEVAV
ncbi:Scr1 family TA system antitoxin-like transcriptional regulator [Streptomyces luomodiensis]|uniref:Scr1 family TA system antitoxin-like transcriptional regulator n=1 Tax=Streptomyces luomodiensis TaxID=3026192 RepID=A0ABY9V0I7_9ACTN|nr:Scr1 family TA system antitoxin-like transcriptional regulator [Streptomyces sp. SCA4-21]WNE98376.1 Scr1 family TA system antitoxin-like transcriptional regulator [Streptomyces sp. SCA4-21]